MTEPMRFSAPFIAMFESLGMGTRFARGRRDARAGHVRQLSVSSSLVVAQVRGPDEPVAARARIAVRAFGAAQWALVCDELAGQARYLADLLAGRLPDGVEEVFAAAGLRLLPDSIDDVAMDCTCQRWPMPCGHLAAACYALARSFDTDPFGALAWRGLGRDELLLRLHQLRGAGQATLPGEAHNADGGTTGPRSAAVGPTGSPADRVRSADPDAPGPAAADHDGPASGLGDPADFWVPAPGVGAYPVGVRPDAGARRSDALLDEWEPLTLDGFSITEALRPAYRALAPDPADWPDLA